MVDLQRLVATTLLVLADALEPAAEAAWDAPSLCERWRVREVVGHLTVPTRYPPEAFLAELRADGGDIGAVIVRLAEVGGALPTPELLAGLRSDVLHAWVPPGGGSEGALLHAVIHSVDVAIPLRLELGLPAEVVRSALDLLAGGAAERFDVDLTGWTLAATDLDWHHGAGAGADTGNGAVTVERTIEASAAELVALLAGRATPAGALRPAAG